MERGRIGDDETGRQWDFEKMGLWKMENWRL